MRLTLRSFALLDILSLLFMSVQIWQIITHFDESSYKLSEQIRVILMFPMFILVIMAAIGLFFVKKFGFILYYIQFPFRLYLWVFTLGFITLLPEAFGFFEGIWFDILLKVCFVAEFIRLYLTIRIHRALFLASQGR